MKRRFYMLALLIVSSSVALAQVGGGNIEFKTKAGKVIFSHENHINAGTTCTDCHPKPFLTQEKHKKVTMAQMAKGESCGKCHNGKVAFSVKTKADCNTCHQK